MLITQEYAQCKKCKVVSKYPFNVYGFLTNCYACDSDHLAPITFFEIEVNA